MHGTEDHSCGDSAYSLSLSGCATFFPNFILLSFLALFPFVGLVFIGGKAFNIAQRAFAHRAGFMGDICNTGNPSSG